MEIRQVAPSQTDRIHSEVGSVLTRRLMISQDELGSLKNELGPLTNHIMDYYGCSEESISLASTPLHPEDRIPSLSTALYIPQLMRCADYRIVSSRQFGGALLMSASVQLRNPDGNGYAEINIDTDTEGIRSFSLKKARAATLAKTAAREQLDQPTCTDILTDIISQSDIGQDPAQLPSSVDALCQPLTSMAPKYRTTRKGILPITRGADGSSELVVNQYYDFKNGKQVHRDYDITLRSRQRLDINGRAFVAIALLLGRDKKSRRNTAILKAGIEVSNGRGPNTALRDVLLDGTLNQYGTSVSYTEALRSNVFRLLEPMG